MEARRRRRFLPVPIDRRRSVPYVSAIVIQLGAAHPLTYLTGRHTDRFAGRLTKVSDSPRD